MATFSFLDTRKTPNIFEIMWKTAWKILTSCLLSQSHINQKLRIPKCHSNSQLNLFKVINERGSLRRFGLFLDLSSLGNLALKRSWFIQLPSIAVKLRLHITCGHPLVEDRSWWKKRSISESMIYCFALI